VILPTLISNFENDGVSSAAGFLAAGFGPFCFLALASPPAAAPASYFLFYSFGFCCYFPF